jgi:ketosteroid isomerase-like protein
MKTPRDVLDALNAAWLSPPDGGIAPVVRGLFTGDAVVVAPDGTRVARGGDLVAASYDDFVRSAKILEVKLEDPIVDEFGDVAIATLGWSMTYEVDGVRSSERGSDTYVLRRSGCAWQICWRAMASSAA